MRDFRDITDEVAEMARVAEITVLLRAEKASGCRKCRSLGGTTKRDCLIFHHVDPTTKSFAVGLAVTEGRSVAEVRAELEKCVVWCKPCHSRHHLREYRARRRAA
jgi:hypothetical protein